MLSRNQTKRSASNAHEQLVKNGVTFSNAWSVGASNTDANSDGVAYDALSDNNPYITKPSTQPVSQASESIEAESDGESKSIRTSVSVHGCSVLSVLANKWA